MLKASLCYPVTLIFHFKCSGFLWSLRQFAIPVFGFPFSAGLFIFGAARFAFGVRRFWLWVTESALWVPGVPPRVSISPLAVFGSAPGAPRFSPASLRFAPLTALSVLQSHRSSASLRFPSAAAAVPSATFPAVGFAASVLPPAVCRPPSWSRPSLPWSCSFPLLSSRLPPPFPKVCPWALPTFSSASDAPSSTL